ncbi:efflux RND transporter periplasmic adaptor subunit [Alteromonadaceae bacterium M269]|nr:efflux RND transporter periplasmic adaptor subunit [Alteromonadaceae bacterium M269]
MSKKIGLSPLWIAVFLLAGLLAYIYYPQSAVQEQRRVNATPVVVHTAAVEEFELVIEGLGTARANEALMITAQESEFVQSVAFNDGDVVEKGQLLVQLNDREELARLKEVEVNLQEANRQLDRIANLAKENAASAQLLDEQEARVKSLAAQKEVIRAQMENLQVRAPFSGRLGRREVSIGALIRPGDTITTLDDVHVIKVDFNLSEANLPSVNEGQLVVATSVAYPGETFRGTISSVDSRVDPTTRAIQVRADIDNPDFKLRPGMLLTVNVQERLLNTLVLPEKAVIPIEDKHFVFVVGADNVASQKEIEVGHRKPGLVEIVSGIREGEKVVVEGTMRLREGSTVRVLEGV